MKRSAFLGLSALAVTAVAAFAGEVAPGDVQFDDYGTVEISLSGVAGDPAAGAAQDDLTCEALRKVLVLFSLMGCCFLSPP